MFHHYDSVLHLRPLLHHNDSGEVSQQPEAAGRPPTAELGGGAGGAQAAESQAPAQGGGECRPPDW